MSLTQKLAEKSKRSLGYFVLGASGLLSLMGCASPPSPAEILRDYHEPNIFNSDFRTTEKAEENKKEKIEEVVFTSVDYTQTDYRPSSDIGVIKSENHKFLDFKLSENDYKLFARNISNLSGSLSSRDNKKKYRIELWNVAVEFVEDNIPVIGSVARGLYKGLRESGQALQNTVNDFTDFHESGTSVAKIETKDIWRMNVGGKFGFKNVFRKGDFLGITLKLDGIKLTERDFSRKGVEYRVMAFWDVGF